MDSANSNIRRTTFNGLENGYVICPVEKRFSLLHKLIAKYRKKKIMVFFSSYQSVQFHHELLNYIRLPVVCLHSKQNQTKRATIFSKFVNAESGVLLCTDAIVEGLAIPALDWIVQYDPPNDAGEYLQRIRRASSTGKDDKSHALLFLRPEETGFINYFVQARVPLNEFDISWSRVVDIQPQLERNVSRNYSLHTSAKAAYKAYVRAYASHNLKTVCNVDTLDLTRVAKNFGLTVPPYVELDRRASGLEDILEATWATW